MNQGEPMFFLEGRAMIRGVEYALDELGLFGLPMLILCDNLPFVQASQRGCSSTRLGNQLVATLDALVVRADATAVVDWIPTDQMLADPFSRVPEGVCPLGAGAEGRLVALDNAPLDPHGRTGDVSLIRMSDAAKVINSAPRVVTLCV